MKMSGSLNQNLGRFLLSLFVIAILSLGIFFRFANLDLKVFWVDEVATAVRVSGYSIPEVVEDLKQQDIVDSKDLLSYQQLTPQRNFEHTWQALTANPEHAPLYFLLTRAWLDFWNDSWREVPVAMMRSLSAWLSLLVFPSLYLLLSELFAQSLISWLGVILMAVSPFFAAYAQEARPYSLWTVAILLMGASLLRAIRLERSRSWVIYGLSLILGFYTSLFSIFVAISQGIYLMLMPTRSQLIKPYLTANVVALVCFSPWLWVIAARFSTLQDNTSWLRTGIDLLVMFATWIGTVLIIFGDLPLSPEVDLVLISLTIVASLLVMIILFWLVTLWQSFHISTRTILKYLIAAVLSGTSLVSFKLAQQFNLDWVTLIGLVIAIIILGFAGFAVVFLVKIAQRSQSLFVLSMLLSLPVPLLLNDLVFGGQSSGAPRYFIPSQLAILIAAAFTLGSHLQKYLQDSRQSRIWILITIFFVGLGIFSCTRNLEISPIYLKSRNVHNPAIAELINQQSQPLVLFDNVSAFDTLSLSHLLNPHVRFKYAETSLEVIDQIDKFNPIYIVSPSPSLKTDLSGHQQIKLEPAFQAKLVTQGQFTLELWEVK